MTTASWSTVLDHSTDAAFRTWGSELNTKFASVGLVQTADTGQINWTTATRAGTNADAGFEIWRLSSSNLYFRINYGTGSSTATPRLSLQVGQGSNGSGTLTGQTSTLQVAIGAANSAPASTVTNYQSLLCATANFFGLSWKIGSISGFANRSRTFWGVGQTVDGTGTASSVGYYVFNTALSGSTAAKLQTVRTTATAATRNATSSFCVMPGQPTNSSDGTNNQIYLHWLDTPSVQPALYTGTIIASELSVGSTLSATLVGSTPHTYVCISTGNDSFDAAATGSPALAAIMLFE